MQQLPGRISVIIPAKDQAPFIQDSLASLERQVTDLHRLEVLVIDDGSCDGTGELAAQFRDRLPDLQIIRNDTARGLATARNQGLAASTAPHIAFLDGDDWFAPGQLARCSEELEALDVDFVRTDHIRVTGGTRVLHRTPQARRGVVLDPRESILPDHASSMVDYPYAWAGMFQRRVAERGLLNFPAGLHTAEDRAWIWNLHLNCDSFAISNAPGVMYRRGIATSLTQIFDIRQLDFIQAYRLTFNVVAKDLEAARFWPKAIRQFLAICAHHLSRRNNMSAEVSTDLALRIKELFLELPADELHAAFTALDGKRAALLRSLMPAGYTRMERSHA
ncbi:glycosyl transferase family 2 [Arthrobacter sp. MYb227]|uniref:glycosyltransferase family 2 protein n=1 Tax=Arthrobacter sp. MYb227 TaxID=1848601 RepID=UPI000CFB77E8|nr:glycosyltransferase family 2 protein [Arthrobacter sp. MYb227]PQZ90290.1 glycosyl transferase family 2 [Arthrobacter sp. MYb227]